MGRGPEDAGVEHSREPDIPRVPGGSGHFLHAIHPDGRLPHDGEVPDGPEDRIFVHLMGDGLAPGQVPVRDAPPPVIRHIDDTIRD